MNDTLERIQKHTVRTNTGTKMKNLHHDSFLLADIKTAHLPSTKLKH